MSDKGWGYLACDKYTGKAKRLDTDLNAHVIATSPGIAAPREDYKFERTAVGDETYCSKGPRNGTTSSSLSNSTEVEAHPTTAFAWEYNVLGRKKSGASSIYIPTDETGARVDWYGCLNYKCCDVLKAWISANRAYFFAASSVTAILLLIGVLVSLRIALHSESDATKMVSHKRDLCIAAIIFFVLIIGAAAVAYMTTSIGNVPQTTTGDIAKDKNITSNLDPGGNASDVCRSPTAGTGTGTSTCVSCENGIRDGDELGIDCGGSCPLSCAAGATCQPCPEGADCKDPCMAGLYCGGDSSADGICRPPTLLELCTDNVQNHGESSLDCGYVWCQRISTLQCLCHMQRAWRLQVGCLLRQALR